MKAATPRSYIMSAPKIDYSKTDPARVTYIERDDRYKRAIGYWPNNDKSKPKVFFLGSNERQARDRAQLLFDLWTENGGQWTLALLEVAESIRLGKKKHVVQLPPEGMRISVIESVDGINTSDAFRQQVVAQGHELAKKVKAIPVMIGEAEDAEPANGPMLYQALDAYAEHCRQHYRTKTAKVEESEVSDFGKNEAAATGRLRDSHPDIALDQFEADAITRIVSYWTSRPVAKTHQGKITGQRISITTVENQVKVLRRFCKWLRRTKQYHWTLPLEAEDIWRVSYQKLLFDEEKAALKDGAKTHTLEELKTLYKYATDHEKVFLLLGLNCGFARAECRTFRTDEIEKGKKSGKTYVGRIRLKTMVYGRFWLWPETVKAVEWFRGQRTPSVLSGSPFVLMAEDGKQYTGQRIKNAWDKLLKRIKKDQPDFRTLPFKHLRKTAAQLMRNCGASTVTVRYFQSRGKPVPSDFQADRYYRRKFKRVFRFQAKMRRFLEPMFEQCPDAFSEPRKKGSNNISLGKIERIKQMAADGCTKSEIVRKLGISRQTVYRHCPKEYVQDRRSESPEGQQHEKTPG